MGFFYVRDGFSAENYGFSRGRLNALFESHIR